MELAFTPEHESFRREVRSWIQEALPADLRAKAEIDANFDMSETMRWHTHPVPARMGGAALAGRARRPRARSDPAASS